MRATTTALLLASALAALPLAGGAGCRSSKAGDEPAGGASSGEAKAVTATARPSTTTTAGPAGKSQPPRAGEAKKGEPPIIEPRRPIRPAREVVMQLAAEKLYSAQEIRDETAKQELLALYTPTATSALLTAHEVPVDAVQVVSKGLGAVPHKSYDVRVTFWWDEVKDFTSRVAKLRRAGRLEMIDVAEVPPPTAEYTQAGKRALRLRGTVRISTAGYDPLSVANPDDALEPNEFKATTEQEALDRLRAWLDEPEWVTPTFERTIDALPPQVVVEHLQVWRRHFELALAGIDEKEALATMQRLRPELEPYYQEPRLSRRADTFVITCEKSATRK